VEQKFNKIHIIIPKMTLTYGRLRRG